MKCQKCHYKNIKRANYCIQCGNKFSKEEKEKAQKEGIVYKIKKIEDWYNKLTLKKWTEHKLVKIAIILGVLLLGLYNYFTNNKLALLISDKYNIKYNVNTNDYYVYLNDKNLDNLGTIALNMQIPSYAKNINLKKYNTNNAEIENINYQRNDNIVVEASTTKEDYYIIDDGKTSLKVYVYLGGK